MPSVLDQMKAAQEAHEKAPRGKGSQVEQDMRARQSQGSAELAAPSPLPGPHMSPLDLLPQGVQDTFNDYSRAALDRVSLGGLPGFGARLQQATGSTAPSPQAEAAAAEKRSPTATVLGGLTGDAALYAATRGAAGAAGAGPLASRLAGAVLPVGAEAFITEQLGGKPEQPVVEGTDALARGAGAVATGAPTPFGLIAQFSRNPLVKALSRALPGGGRIPEALAVGAPMLASELLRTGGTEREEAAKRERRRRENGGR